MPLLLDEVHHLIESNKSLQFILCGSSADLKSFVHTLYYRLTVAFINFAFLPSLIAFW
ncbi:hypothetical protein [Rickettsia endosymbiont of Halotydeus destructor]|uniref:hypothetical protein n=1 Tax=Rickettsia endosymbiont of Halotydeus destructor TaxID=2996754 RepID=UPI003BAE59BB